jgi:hypothetical protein
MKSKYVGVGMGMGISLGLCFAAAFGTAMQNVALGLAFGVAFGLALSADSGAALARKNVTSDKPLPHPLGLFERDHHPN